MEHLVKGCEDCCFYNAYFGGEHISGQADAGDSCCNHPKAPVKENGKMYKMPSDTNFNPITPDWCPLKKEPITISKTQ